jgi:hypothetical protein
MAEDPDRHRRDDDGASVIRLLFDTEPACHPMQSLISSEAKET